MTSPLLHALLELEPCPFCKGIADTDQPNLGHYVVYCKDCGATIGNDDPDHARAAWNRREPNRHDVLEKLSYHALERDDLSLEECLTYLRTGGWHEVPGRADRAMVLQITALLAGHQPERTADCAGSTPPVMHTASADCAGHAFPLPKAGHAA
ncbi:MAG: Lar family restriction alleviation protein [Burkholderiales bacterium]|nr:Lar family restriction alleviation protein [Burkholderiales bacterium]